MPVVMASTWEKQVMSRLIRDAIVQLCKTHQVYGGNVEVDGIVCITGKAEGQELVVKVHEKLGSDSRLVLTDFLTRPREGWSSILSTNNNNDNAEDYSIKRQRLDETLKSAHDADSYPNLKQHLMNPSQHPRELQNKENQQAPKDLSKTSMDVDPTSPTDQQFESPTISPGGSDRPSDQPPHSPGSYNSQYLTSTPHSIFPRRIPLRNDRWSPNQTPPTVPECKQCGYIFNNFEVLSDHNEAVHSAFTCQSCFKTFTSRSNLERHSRLHTGHRPYNCTICGKSFSRKDHLSNHATKHAYKCGTCSKRFTDKKMLVTHYSFDHNALLTNICDFCNKGFSSNDQYDEHLKQHPQCNGGKDDDECMPQNLSTYGESSMLPKYICKVCAFSTADKLTLLKHQIIHQDNTRCYTCLSCAKMFEDPLHYSDHLLVHSGETNIFECCICRQICPTITSLRRHEATHLTMSVQEPDTDDVFDCPKCDKSFSSRYNLEEHMELHQKTQQGFECTVCHEKFEEYSQICSHIEQEGHYVYPGTQENGAVAETTKNKRKQKLPKSVKSMTEMDQESDVEVVEPMAPEDALNDEEMANGAAGYTVNNGEFVITENPARVIEIRPEDDHDSSNTEPIKSLLSRAIQARKDKPDTMDKLSSQSVLADLIHRPPPTPSKRRNRSPEKAAKVTPSEANNNSTSSNNNMLLSPKLMNVEIPEGPYNCSICTSVMPTFQELEMHCFSEHNRSPCMFCAKTFAQKANRDRHVCLHTGEKPYGCPDCSEKFSRGDKLKIHRMRVHQTVFPSLPSRTTKDRDASVSPSMSPSASQDSLYPDGQEDWAGNGGDWALRRDAPHDYVAVTGEWSTEDADDGGKRTAPNDYVAVTGEWSVKEIDDSGIDNANDLTIDETK